MKRKIILRIILIPFLLFWFILFLHYGSAMHYMIGLGWGTVETAPIAYLIVQSWILLSAVMIMVILILLVFTFDEPNASTDRT